MELRTAWSDGTTHLLFEGVELLEKLAAPTILSRTFALSPAEAKLQVFRPARPSGLHPPRVLEGPDRV